MQSADVQMAPPPGLHLYSSHRPTPAQHMHEQHAHTGTIVPSAPIPVEQMHTSEAPACEPKGKQREEPVFIPKGMPLHVLSEDQGEQQFRFIPGKSSAFPIKPVKQRSYAYTMRKAPANRVKLVSAMAPLTMMPAAQASSCHH